MRPLKQIFTKTSGSLLLTAILLIVFNSCRKSATEPLNVKSINKSGPANFTAIVSPFPSTLSVGLVAYWPLANNAYDLSGNGFNGSIKGVTPVADREGNTTGAYHFNGTGSSIAVPDNAALRLDSDFTINAWVKLNNYNTSYGAAIMSKRGPGENNGWCWTIGGQAGAGTTGVAVYGPGIGNLASGKKVVPLGQWHMVTCEYGLSTQKLSIYIDGVLDSVTNNVVPANASVTAGLYIGRDGLNVDDNGYYFKGALNDIRMYNRQISSAELSQLYKATTAPTAGLIAYWPLTNTANDLSGNGHNGTVHGITTTTDRLGNPIGAYHFNGTGSYIVIPDNVSLRLDSDFSINAWVKLLAYNSGLGCAIMTKRMSGFNNGWAWTVSSAAGSGTNGLTDFVPGQGPTALGQKALNLDQWHMVTCVYSVANESLSIYIDGVLDNTSTGVLPANAAATAELYIGRDNPNITTDNGYFFKGAMNDLRMYSRQISATEIQQLYGALN